MFLDLVPVDIVDEAQELETSSSSLTPTTLPTLITMVKNCQKENVGQLVNNSQTTGFEDKLLDIMGEKNCEYLWRLSLPKNPKKPQTTV